MPGDSPTQILRLFVQLGTGSLDTLKQQSKYTLFNMLPRMMSSLARQQFRLVPITLSTLQPLRSRQQQQQQQQHTKHSTYYTSIAAVAASVGTVAAFSSTTSSSCEGNTADSADSATTEGDAVDMQSNLAVPEASLRKLYPPIEPYNSGHLQVVHKLTNAILQVKRSCECTRLISAHFAIVRYIYI
jgi:hypothetical protein